MYAFEYKWSSSTYVQLLLAAALLIHQDKAPSCGLKATKKMCMVCNKEKSPGKKQLRQLFPATAELLEAVTALEKARDPNVSGWSVKILQKTVPNSLPSAACNQDEQLLIHAICRQNIWNAHRALQLRVEKVGGTTYYYFF